MLPPIDTATPEWAIVLVSPLEADGRSLRSSFAQASPLVHWFPDCESALAFLRENTVGVVISKPELPDGCWKALLGSLSQFKPTPNLIVASRLADERFWAEVLNLGGYDVLLTPFEPNEVVRVTTSARLAWKTDVAQPAPLTPWARRPLGSSAGKNVAVTAA